LVPDKSEMNTLQLKVGIKRSFGSRPPKQYAQQGVSDRTKTDRKPA